MHRRTSLIITTIFCYGLAAAGFALAESEFGEEVAPFLAEHCADCHGADKQKSGVRFDAIKGYRAEDAILWTKVHRMLRSDEMPPKKRERPEEKQTAAVMKWIEASQAEARSGHTRRLNRREFSAALQQLTGLEVDFAGGLPEDGKVGGFDTGADGLKDAADSVKQMLENARRTFVHNWRHAPFRFPSVASVR